MNVFQFALRCSGAFLCTALFATHVFAADPFAEGVRTTESLSPAEQQKTFKLPPGFEVQLVASEPDFIGKPINMAWDAKGRLWVTISREYPFPIPVGEKGRDVIKVMEDFDATGRARKISTFVDGLNIPIGLYPYKNGVIAFSIPNVSFYQDTDGDGRADKSEIIMTRYGFEKDTHGMTGAFRRGYDGWLYADHGFNNDSTLTAKDGTQIRMNSGNVYRMKIDGSHIEQFTWGQVNPFGLSFDPLGDLWSSDCHSSPVYMLLRNGRYPSFGKPHDGLGYAPNICAHSHGSTAISGILFYSATNFPAEFRNNTYIGNVMTSRINRDSYIEKGSTRIAKEEPDFLSSTDPWFRPVDIQLGPDGAMYVADFYNRIIGHYEVPLTHPGRDRERGRIWRVVYTGNAGAKEVASKGKKAGNALAMPQDVKDLVAELGNENMTRRMLAADQLVDRIGDKAIKPVQALLKSKKANPHHKVHGMWVLYRLGALEEKQVVAASTDKNREVRVHCMRVLSEVKDWSSQYREIALAGLRDSDAYVQRAAADALGRHPRFENVGRLMVLRNQVPAEDSQLLHVVRMALRDQMTPESLVALRDSKMGESESRAIAEVAAGVKIPEAGAFLLDHIQRFSEPRERMTEYLRHAARYSQESSLTDLATFTRSKFADDLDFQLTLFKSIKEGLQQRGAKLDGKMVEWGTELAGKLLASVDPKTLDWRNSPIKGGEATNPWTFQDRPCADGKTSQVISSLVPGGEKFTGILRSRDFVLPEKLSFYLCGHDGSPEKPARNKNMIRLRDSESNKVIAQQYPPRNDTAQLITWDLAKYRGKKGSIEIVDGNTGHSYAWIGVGRFSPEVVPFPKVIPSEVDKRQLLAAELAESLQLKTLQNGLADLLKDADGNEDARAAAAKALVTLNGPAHISTLAVVMSDADSPMKVRVRAAQSLAQINSEESRRRLIEVLATAPDTLQTQIAVAMSSNPEGAETLLSVVEGKKVSAHVLQDAGVKDKLKASKPKNVVARLEELTKNLTPISVEKQKIIEARRAAFAASEGSVDKGALIFTQSCAACHQLRGQGTLVGPQLDGIGNRGAERLIEDILDPNRNVDHAFRYSNVTLKDEQVISGLFRREEGAVLVFADATGKEVSVPKVEIAERRESENSLMPDNFDQILPEGDFNDLIAFLLKARN